MTSVSPISQQEWLAREKCSAIPYALAVLPDQPLLPLFPAASGEATIAVHIDGTDFLCMRYRHDHAYEIAVHVHSDEPSPEMAMEKLLRATGVRPDEMLWQQTELGPPRFRVVTVVPGTMAEFPEPRGTFHEREAAEAYTAQLNKALEGHHSFCQMKELSPRVARVRG